ncbi:MAG: hypothetical protein H0X28_05075 [Solirubrobacterales bacterium]|nr:hypothetical protein [Solirubrobacterales bacterium]
MARNGHEPEPRERSPWNQPAFLAAGALVGIILVLGLVLAVTGTGSGSGGHNATGLPKSEATTPPAPGVKNAQASICGLPAGDQSVPNAAPTNTTWTLIGTVAAPQAPQTIGPKITAHSVHTCFAHSPLGALYAAVNFVASTSAPSERAAAARYLTAAGRARELSLARERHQPGGSANEGGGGLQVAGFVFTTYSASSAVLDLALRLATGNRTGYVHLPLAMHWQDGDWKYVIPETGEPFGALQRVPDLSGYIAWSGT